MHSASFKTSSVALDASYSTLASFHFMLRDDLPVGKMLYALIPMFLNPSLQSHLCLTNINLRESHIKCWIASPGGVGPSLQRRLETRIKEHRDTCISLTGQPSWNMLWAQDHPIDWNEARVLDWYEAKLLGLFGQLWQSQSSKTWHPPPMSYAVSLCCCYSVLDLMTIRPLQIAQQFPVLHAGGRFIFYYSLRKWSPKMTTNRKLRYRATV